MRTLKKALSLVLVLAMVFALAVPGFAADTTKKASDFKDYSKVTNKEAVDVLTAAGVVSGNTDGTFGPEGSFTRAQAASIIAHMMLGAAADAQPSSATKFTDVPATHWASKYIAYCAQQGIVNGYGNGKFGPDDALSAHSWALMLLGALGYNAKNEGIGGAGWEIGTTTLAIQSGVASAADLTATFNRDVAIKMAYNTLTANLVKYSNGVNVSTGDGTNVTVNATRSIVAGPAAATDNYDGVCDGVMQFCEQYMTGLKKVSGATDVWGVAGYDWRINNVKAAGTYTSAAKFTYTKSMASAADTATVTTDLAGYNIGSVKPLVNGTEGTAVTTVAGIVALTGNGKVVSIYVNDNTTPKTVSAITVQSYDMYKVALVNGNASTVTLTRASKGTAGTATVTLTKTNANKAYYNEFAAMAKGDFVLMATKNDGTILATAQYTTANGAFTAYTASTVTVGGTAYTVAANAASNVGMTASTGSNYDLYIDQFGNALYAESKTATTQLAFALATSRDGSALSGYEYSAQLVFADGTTKWVKLNKVHNGTSYVVPGSAADTTGVAAALAGNSADKDKFVEYTANDDGTYNVKFNAPATSSITAISSDNPTLDSTHGIIANSKTVFVVKQSDGSYKTFTGIKNAPKMTSITTAYVDGVIAKMVVVNNGSVTGTDSKYLYVYDVATTKTEVSGSDTLRTYNAIVDGVKTTVVTKNLDLSTVSNVKGLYVNYTTDGENHITALGSKLVVGTTNGAKGNISVAGDTGLKAALKDGVLTLTKNTADIKVATSDTTGEDHTATTVTVSVADGFNAYVINSTATPAATAEGYAIGETAAVLADNVAGVFATVNASGEVTALYIVNA